jgi:hypothetical protein
VIFVKPFQSTTINALFQLEKGTTTNLYFSRTSQTMEKEMMKKVKIRNQRMKKVKTMNPKIYY